MQKLIAPLMITLLATNLFVAPAAKASANKKHHKQHNYKGEMSAVAPAAMIEEKPLGTLTGNFDFTSNYMFRGISNSNNLPAVQGGLTYTFTKPGIYFNLWGSNVNFAAPNGDTATVEFDTIAGIKNTIGDNFTYDLNIDRYNYPKATSANYNEFNTTLTYRFLAGKFAYSNNVYGSHKNGEYYEADLNLDIPPDYVFHQENVSVQAAAGHYSLPHSAGLFSYNNFSLQVNKTINPYVLSLQWTSTSNAHLHPLDGSHLVGTVTVNF